jgi:hypothetical protein
MTTNNYLVLPISDSKETSYLDRQIVIEGQRFRLPYLAERTAYEGLRCSLRDGNKSMDEHHASCS